MPSPIPAQDFANVKGHAAGTLFVAPDGDVLLVRRSTADGGNFQGYWALPGGGAEHNETPDQAADREAFEELGPACREAGAPKALDARLSGTGDVAFHTFARPVPIKFTPDLNKEHDRYLWFPLNALPAPMHPGVRATMDERIGIRGDMEPADWDALIASFTKWASEEQMEDEHAEDCALAFDRLVLTMAGAPHRDGMAFDRASVRYEDANGHLHVAVSNISKSTINEYLGREIPKWRELGLEPERIYKLLRDPTELSAAAPTFNNLPLLTEHVAVTADKHPGELVVGSTGTDAEFAPPYLRNSLVIWTRGGIDAVKSQAKKELSCAYRYRADMTPGTWQGENYDGVMRDIVGNHVALVEEGRAGADVVVGDSKEGIMAKPHILTRKASLLQGAVATAVLPLLAKDSKLRLNPILAKVTAKSLATDHKAVALAIHKHVEPLLAKDKKLSLDDVEQMADLLNKYDDDAPEKGTKDAAETDPSTGMPMAPSTMDEGGSAAEFLASVLTPEQMAQYQALMNGGASDEPPPFKGKPEVGKGPSGAKDEDPDDKDKKDDEDEDKMGKDAVNKLVAQAAKDATEAAKKHASDLRAAERQVAPYVGELAMTFDSAEELRRHVLKISGIKNHDKVPAEALADMVDMLPKPDARKPRDPAVALDAASVKDFATRYPHANRINVI